jgi:hypothetical protein
VIELIQYFFLSEMGVYMFREQSGGCTVKDLRPIEKTGESLLPSVSPYSIGSHVVF